MKDTLEDLNVLQKQYEETKTNLEYHKLMKALTDTSHTVTVRNLEKQLTTLTAQNAKNRTKMVALEEGKTISV